VKETEGAPRSPPGARPPCGAVEPAEAGHGPPLGLAWPADPGVRAHNQACDTHILKPRLFLNFLYIKSAYL
jgi:hypothetical protein